MPKRAKCAYAKKEATEEFVSQNRGNLASFQQAIKATFEDMYANTKMIQESRKMRRMERKRKLRVWTILKFNPTLKRAGIQKRLKFLDSCF